MKKFYRVYIPVKTTEVYDVWADSKKQAKELVISGKAQCLGEWNTNYETITTKKLDYEILIEDNKQHEKSKNKKS